MFVIFATGISVPMAMLTGSTAGHRHTLSFLPSGVRENIKFKPIHAATLYSQHKCSGPISGIKLAAQPEEGNCELYNPYVEIPANENRDLVSLKDFFNSQVSILSLAIEKEFYVTTYEFASKCEKAEGEIKRLAFGKGITNNIVATWRLLNDYRKAKKIWIPFLIKKDEDDLEMTLMKHQFNSRVVVLLDTITKLKSGRHSFAMVIESNSQAKIMKKLLAKVGDAANDSAASKLIEDYITFTNKWNPSLSINDADGAELQTKKNDFNSNINILYAAISNFKNEYVGIYDKAAIRLQTYESNLQEYVNLDLVSKLLTEYNVERSRRF